MKAKTKILVSLMAIIISSCVSKQEGKHLFILSGQSNMEGLKPEESFTPAVKEKFGEEHVVVVKHAKGTQPISQWYRDWKSLEGNISDEAPVMYDILFSKVNKAIENEKIATVTFIWMQGERDARLEYGDVYEKSLIGLYKQLCKDLRCDDINFVIGRLSDFGLTRKSHPHWSMIREIQVEVAESNFRFDWINTDDLNNGINRAGEEINNDIHMSAEGYVMMGKRFAEKSIKLIENTK